MNRIIEKKYASALFELKAELIDSCELCEDGHIYNDHEESKDIKFSPKMQLCKCREKFDEKSKYLTANIPRDFWPNKRSKSIECKEYLFEKTKFGRIKAFDPIVRKYIKNKKQVLKHGLSFMLSGMNGTGKTHTSVYILKRFLRSGYTAYYIHFRELMNIYYLSIAKRDSEAQTWINYLLNVDILCIDELGKENSTTDVVIVEFEYWLKTRLERNKPTIIITNRTIIDDKGAFETVYGESVWDIFKKNYRMFRLNPNSDFRLKTRKDWNKILK